MPHTLEELDEAAGFLVSSVALLHSTIGRIVVAMPQGELRKSSLEGLEVADQAIEILREMFPTPKLGDGMVMH